MDSQLWQYLQFAYFTLAEPQRIRAPCRRHYRCRGQGWSSRREEGPSGGRRLIRSAYTTFDYYSPERSADALTHSIP